MDKKKVLITGGNAGIGFAVVKKLLKENENVLVILTSKEENEG